MCGCGGFSLFAVSFRGRFNPGTAAVLEYRLWLMHGFELFQVEIGESEIFVLMAPGG